MLPIKIDISDPHYGSLRRRHGSVPGRWGGVFGEPKTAIWRVGS